MKMNDVNIVIIKREIAYVVKKKLNPLKTNKSCMNRLATWLEVKQSSAAILNMGKYTQVSAEWRLLYQTKQYDNVCVGG